MLTTSTVVFSQKMRRASISPTTEHTLHVRFDALLDYEDLEPAGLFF